MSKFDNRLRKHLEDYIEDNNTSVYKVSENVGIKHQILYRFVSGGGLNGENTVKLMDYLNVDLKKLNK